MAQEGETVTGVITKDQPDRLIPRGDIHAYHGPQRLEGETYEDQLQRRAREKPIEDEVNRRFAATLEEIHPEEFLADKLKKEEWKKWRAANPEGDPDDFSFPESEIRLLVSEELADPYVARFLRSAVGLAIFANRQTDAYMADTKTFRPDPSDPVLRAINYLKNKEIKKLYEEEKEHFRINLVKRFGPPPSETGWQGFRKQFLDEKYTHSGSFTDDEKLNQIDKEEEERLADEYFDWEGNYVQATVDEIDYDHYTQLVEHIAGKVSVNSYLEDLFQTFTPEKNRHHAEVFYREKLERLARELSPFTPLNPEVKGWEGKIRTHITVIYQPFVALKLPSITYINADKIPEFEERTHARKSPAEVQHVGRCIEYFDYDGIRIPVNFAYMGVFPDVASIDHARGVFEELYHSTFFSLRKPGSVWPYGDTFFEEGLTKAEIREYFHAFREDMMAPGTEANKITRRRAGEDVGPFWRQNITAGAFMVEIAARCGSEDFFGLLRQARAGDAKDMGRVRERINEVFGAGTYEKLLTLKGYDNDTILTTRKELGFKK